ncbi:T9SS type A sorting domain-containing protein [Cytophagaceae bacterium ABcell3]|nr:T9SS type A sorting domain-containing protein [Cytophagaceae bacterium ABcell3]
MVKSCFATVIILFLFTGFLQAQSTTLSSGGEASGDHGSLSYSVGQPVFSYTSNSSGSLSEGVQQAYEIDIVSGVDLPIELEATIYPNPTTDYINLRVEDESFENLSFTLTDVQGKTLLNDEVTDKESSIPMANHNSGIYFLRVIRDNEEIKLFKIIKN